MTQIIFNITRLEEYTILSTKSEAKTLVCTVLELSTAPHVIQTAYHRKSCKRRYSLLPLEQRNPTWGLACKRACQKI